MNRRSQTSSPDSERRGDAAVEAALLRRAVTSLLRCDDAEVVGGIARYVMTQHASLRGGAALMERTRGTAVPAVAAVLGACVRFLEVVDGGDGDAVWVARLTNERRAVERLPSLVPELAWTELTFRLPPGGAALAAVARDRGRARHRISSIARRLHRRHEYFKVMRVAELVGYYARYVDLFRRGRFRVAVTSNHSNPHGIAFATAARRCGIPVVLVTHGMPVRPVARLAYDLAVVHSEAALATYRAEGCRIDRAIIHGRRQHYRPMPDGPLPDRVRVGVLLCKDVEEGRVRRLVDGLLRHPRVARVVVRPHPRNLWRGLDAWLASRNDPRLVRGSGASVARDLEETDVVVAGNSSVLVDAVTAGRPGAYVEGLDAGPADLHGFVARGLVCALGDEERFDPEALVRFYARPDWPEVLRVFANVDDDEASVADRLTAGIRDLAQSRERPVGSEKVRNHP